MRDDIGDIASYYDRTPEREHARLEQHQLEHDLTWYYLERYLPARGRILEVGAATGRYTLELARRGYTVTAVDLSAANIAQCRQSLAAAGLAQQVGLVVADGRDLSAVAERDFDAALLMGPLYHLIVAADRAAALQQALDRLLQGGVLFSTFLSRYGVLSDLLKTAPNWIDDPAEVRSLLEHGKRPDTAPRGGFRGYFARVDEITPLHQAMGLKTLAIAGVDPVIAADDESYNRLEGAQRRRWLEVLAQVSREPSILGAARHILYIGQKT